MKLDNSQFVLKFFFVPPEVDGVSVVVITVRARSAADLYCVRRTNAICVVSWAVPVSGSSQGRDLLDL